METQVYVASAFSKNNGGGNKAGVVLESSGLSVLQKMQISRELGYSETAFLSKSEVADYKIEYFTPTEEVPLCGHGTIASFSVLYLLGKIEKEIYTIETKAGVLEIRVKEDGLVLMEQNCPVYYDVLECKEIEDSIPAKFIDEKLPIQIVSTGLKDILLPIKDMNALEKMSPDFSAMTELSRIKDVIGVHAFTLTEDSEITAVCRNFAPLYGIDEESATGTSNCALACYLYKYFGKKTSYIFEQGYTMGLPSRIMVDLDVQDGEIEHVYVGGYGYMVENKSFELLEVLRAEEEWQRAGAYSVRIQGMNRQYHIPLREEFDEHDGDGTRYIVLLDSGYPVATCRFYELNQNRVMIGRVVVLPEYRGKGIGLQVIREAEQWIKELGYEEIEIESRLEAVAFYKKLDFIEVDAAVVQSGCFSCIKMRKSLI